MSERSISSPMNKVAIFGYGTVGKGVYDYLKNDKDTEVKAIFGRENKRKELGDLLEIDYKKIVDDEEIDTIFECLGKDDLSYKVIKKSLMKKKNVISSNKETISNHLKEYLDLANMNGCSIQFEASVGGQIPLIYPLLIQSQFEKITEIYGILNGTSNYILTKMVKDDSSFSDALKEAQEKGFAELDPSADLSGLDMIRKSAIIASIITKKEINQKEIISFGIQNITKEILNDLKEDGLTLKFVSHIQVLDDELIIEVIPTAFKDSILNSIYYEKNAIIINNDISSPILISSNGAGKYPTASSMMQDYQRVKSKTYLSYSLSDKIKIKKEMIGKFYCYKNENKDILINPQLSELKNYDVVIKIVER